ncbi:ABC transporter, substrate-binding protein (cluster 8, B12/iron complex) [hydrothermal vent metagenome]|uniref:ABC transporter, substrate-binding protein (Cluster 8, B12/iron complex) n=1 Tax=hydrothermal vent metagenome TaxID=652676 RepID=A0A3B1CNH8_9ZZZZ
MKIVSFLPSATEMLYTLGLEDQLVGITHECDFPVAAAEKPVVVRNVIDMTNFTQEEIDQTVKTVMHEGKSLYAVDELLLKQIAPDLILTQDLCQVCAPSGNEVSRVLEHLPKKPQIEWLTPTCLNDIFENFLQIGRATGKENAALEIVKTLKKRVAEIRTKVSQVKSRPRVFFMEWLSPPYCGGHWVGEMIDIAGGDDSLAKKGADSVRVPWESILAAEPEILILSPCGFDLEKTLQEAHLLKEYPHWETLPAVKNGRVYAVDANSYFARPGPRVVDGIELLAHLFHPEVFEWSGSEAAFRILNTEDF